MGIGIFNITMEKYFKKVTLLTCEYYNTITFYRLKHLRCVIINVMSKLIDSIRINPLYMLGKEMVDMKNISNDLPGPEVSIITPVYNGFHYVMSAVNSVLSQSFNNFEWIIINDKSSDDTAALLETLPQRDMRIKVINHKENKGPIHARNSGFEVAKGRYIAFLDIDDLWDDKKLEKQLAFMKENDAALSYTAYHKFSDKKIRNLGNTINIPKAIDINDIIKTCSIMASSAVFDRNKIGHIKQDITVPHKDDLHLWIRILEKTGTAYGLNEDLASLRIHRDSVTGKKMVEAQRQWIFYRKFLKFNFFKTLYYFFHYAIYGTWKYLHR